ncbi:thymidylate synthase [Seohaeicola nanhaiensis]|uniref:Thymidylate synthase n=1 Tax=Seohaeicola nanhaiensis TaxID=1387282 RepID=A0ABV9KBW8_9RHOB
MKRFSLSIAACAALAACSGGNPFAGTDTETPDSGIPAALASDLDGVTYNPVAQTLTVRGVSLDNTPYEVVYERKPGLDRGGYEAYTAQQSSLQRHTTAYVKDIDGTRAAVVVTGGQFRHYFAGTVYGRNGAFDPPPSNSENQLVSYAGNYVGLLNMAGDGGDLKPVAPGTNPDIRPVQAAEVTGKVLVNADFSDNMVNGSIYERTIVDGGTALSTLDLDPTTIDATEGTFTGEVSINLQNKGTYGGIFGGQDSSAVAGSVFVKDHIDGVDNEEEYGIFVLPKCGTPGQDALCNQPNP